MDIVLEKLGKSFNGKLVFENLSLTFAEGRTSCLTGPSGCGKTTVLDIIAGISPADSGRVLGTEGRKMAYVFQEPRLLPWKTVLQNVEFVLPPEMSPEEKERRGMECLAIVELEAEASEFPAELSRGMAQRVSLARALAADADILLLDEPFSGIDAALKERISARLGHIWSERRTTVILVSHSEEDAGGADVSFRLR